MTFGVICNKTENFRQNELLMESTCPVLDISSGLKLFDGILIVYNSLYLELTAYTHRMSVARLFHFITFIPRLCIRDVANNPQHSGCSAHSRQISRYWVFQSDMDLWAKGHSAFGRMHRGRLKIETSIRQSRSSKTACVSSA